MENPLAPPKDPARTANFMQIKQSSCGETTL